MWRIALGFPVVPLLNNTKPAHPLALKLDITNFNKGYLSLEIAITRYDVLTGERILNILSEFERAVSYLNPNRNNIENWQVIKTSRMKKIKLVTDKYNETFFVI